MNKQCYRLIFSQVRGMLVAVAEIVTSAGKAPGESRAAKRRGESRSKLGSQLTAMAYGVSAVLGGAMLAPMDSYSQTIVADPNAPANQRPTVGTTQNGVPLVNIQGPSKAGVSRNTYSQFDVQQPGVILNNSTKNVQQTELGGMIRGNANLKGRNARVILNEVNSPDASQLRGQIEVAGQRAQVVIANPSGVTCDGCGFINVTRGTLTTGTAIVNDGDLQGFLVRGGTVRIDGAGFDASRTTGAHRKGVHVD
jgi:filamentous hemagglutinin